MVKQRITEDAVKGLAPGAVIFDTEVRGFMVRHRGGSPVYGIKTRIKGRQTILTIGRHGKGAYGPERARREAIRLLGLIRDGKDIAADRAAAKAAPVLADFSTRYMTEYAERRKKPRTKAEDQRLLKLHILPALGTSKVRDIGKADVARLHAKLHNTPIAANRALALLSSILGWAEKIGERPDGSNPCRHVERFPERRRERVLTADELAQLGEALTQCEAGWTEEAAEAWRKRAEAEALAAGKSEEEAAEIAAARKPERLDAEHPSVIAAVRLLVFTGARLSEVLGLEWGWIDVRAGTARLPDSKTGAKTIYLSAPALELLAELPRIAGNPHVIPGDRAGKALTPPQHAWQRIRKVAGLADLRLHDLRHGFASSAVSAGDSLFIVGKLLGHRQSATSERYAHLAPDPARAVADRTAERLRAMMQGGKGELIDMPAPRRGRP
jgi:integrase